MCRGMPGSEQAQTLTNAKRVLPAHRRLRRLGEGLRLQGGGGTASAAREAGRSPQACRQASIQLARSSENTAPPLRQPDQQPPSTRSQLLLPAAAPVPVPVPVPAARPAAAAAAPPVAPLTAAVAAAVAAAAPLPPLATHAAAASALAAAAAVSRPRRRFILRLTALLLCLPLLPRLQQLQPLRLHGCSLMCHAGSPLRLLLLPLLQARA